MCGICGQYNVGTLAPVQRDDIELMTDTLTHRGPDDEGYYIDGPIGLGFRRLSIIDLSGGHQPMYDDDRAVYVVFNGEIYNYRELRQELETHGHVFRTKSDTEVIVHGYKRWGDDVLLHLNGMFGLAIWDARQRRLVLARDPFGIKLVYYRTDAGRLYFASEMRALRAVTEQSLDVDPVALNLFLRYRYTPSPYTIYNGVHKLPAGTKLVAQDGNIVVSRWYNFKPTPFAERMSTRDAVEELHTLYQGAMRRHLISDVPVGLLLSGGIDSGLLLALMNLNGHSWPTYSVGYGAGYADDELEDAAETARTLGSKHTSVRITRSVFEETLPKIVRALEEPIATSSIVPMYFVCERARHDVKVGLIGQGPDELFGGYRRHLGVRYGALFAGLPGWMRDSIASIINILPRNEAFKRGAQSLAIPDRIRRYQNVLSLLPGTEIDGLFRDGQLGSNAGDSILDCWGTALDLMPASDELGGFQFLEVRSTLPDELLMYADKLSMAHGLELRVPYLDKEIVEFVERLPAQLKVRNGSGKWLHRRVCSEYLPQSIVKRRKRGFACNVVDEWFRSSVSTKMADILLDPSSKIYEYLRPSAVGELMKAHSSGRNDNHKILFSLIVFEEWLRVHEEPVAALA
jgi:asparagine synthase (glutamine-hydrolysing)